MKNKFGIRDLVNAGVFSLLTLMATWCGGMIGFVPVLMPFVPFFCGLLSGPVFMLYSTKINKFGMMLIMGVIFGLVFSMSGHGAITFPLIIIFSLLAEYVLKKGNYKSKKICKAILCCVYAFWSIKSFTDIFGKRCLYKIYD